uniref:Putative glycosylphosphatidylinositol anchor synthesis protein n=1 Tax=Amblyomma triste TaxID=251400 RepID=A0A023G4D5_AMBTT
MLLDAPIPYSNLGSLILQAFPGVRAKDAGPAQLLPLWLNVQQVARYLGKVPNTPLQPELRLQELQQLWDQCLGGQQSSEAARIFVNASLVFLQDARRAAQEVWATFDIPRMYTGLAITVLGSLLLLCFCLGQSGGKPIHELLKSPTCVCAVSWLLMPFSNSFAVAEHKVVLFLFQTLLVASVLSRGPVTLNTSRNRALAFFLLGTLAAARFSALFWRCREEHLGQPCEESVLQKSPSEPQVLGLERVLGASGCALLLAWGAWPPRASSGLGAALARVGLMAATGALLAHWFVQLKPPATIQGVLGSHQELLPNTAMVVSVALALLGWAVPHSSPSYLGLLPASALLFLLTLAGESYAVPLCLQAAALWGLTQLWSSAPPTDVWVPAMSWLLLGQLGFFGTGHQTSFSTIHWKAAFVGARLDQPPMTLGAFKVLLNTFAGPLVAAASLPVMQRLLSTQVSCCGRKEILPLAAFCTLLVLQVCSTMVSCLLLRRHLMMWSVFAPRLVFQVLSAGFSIVAAICGCIVSRRTMLRTQVLHVD